MTTAETFARRLREERERTGVSQTELAHRITELLGTTVYPTAITKVEKSERSVKLEEAVAMADALGVPLPSLLSDGGAAAVRLGELRREIERQESRARTAEHEYQQAQAAMIDLQREIAQLESASGD